MIGAEKSIIPHPSQYLAVNKRSVPNKPQGTMIMVYQFEIFFNFKGVKC